MRAGRIKEDNPDSLVNQEVLLPGQVWAMITKERLLGLLTELRGQLERELRPRDPEADVPDFDDNKWFRATLDKVAAKHNIGQRLEYFLATGNLQELAGGPLLPARSRRARRHLECPGGL